MTIKELREQLDLLDDDTILVVHAPDHEYRIPNTFYSHALQTEDGTIYEDFGDNHKLDPKDKRIRILIIA